MKKPFPHLQACVLVIVFACVQAVSAQGTLNIAYTVELKDPATQQFHITTEIKNINQPQLALSLPTWTPGWYTVENYGKNLIRFEIKDDKGNRMQPRMTRKQTWTIDTSSTKSIRVDYDYSATVLALNQAKVAKDYAFFTGIELFLEPEGHRSTPSTLRFSIPKGWKLISALKETSDPNVFTAADYDTLVDAPALMGNFDLAKFEVEGKPYYFTAVPAGTFSAEKTKKFTDMLAKVAVAQGKMFDGQPWDKYIAFYFFTPPESNASGALEHLNSFVAFAPPGDVATPEMLIGTASHEYYHLWNVKRFRPAEMWPYDYSDENESPLLWVSEGFTNYYGAVGVYRAGLMTPEQFVNRAAGAAAGIESNPARHYVSLANASVSTWLGYDTPQAFTISYYGGGQNIAALLDLSIRHDTEGRASLDDVMRALYNDFYKRGKGFTSADLLGVINRVSGKDYAEFFNRHIYGTDVPDYDRVFGYAGYRLDKKPRQVAEFGFNGRFRNGGFTINGIDTGSPADKAGLRIGDVIMKVNGTATQQVDFGELAGKTVKLTVAREGAETVIPMTVGTTETTWYELAPLPNATAAQLNVRAGWLKREVAAAAVK